MNIKIHYLIYKGNNKNTLIVYQFMIKLNRLILNCKNINNIKKLKRLINYNKIWMKLIINQGNWSLDYSKFNHTKFINSNWFKKQRN